MKCSKLSAVLSASSSCTACPAAGSSTSWNFPWKQTRARGNAKRREGKAWGNAKRGEGRAWGNAKRGREEHGECEEEGGKSMGKCKEGGGEGRGGAHVVLGCVFLRKCVLAWVHYLGCVLDMF